MIATNPCKGKEGFVLLHLGYMLLERYRGDSFSGLNNEDERWSSLLTIVHVSLHNHKRRTAAPRVGHRSNNYKRSPIPPPSRPHPRSNQRPPRQKSLRAQRQDTYTFPAAHAAGETHAPTPPPALRAGPVFSAAPCSVYYRGVNLDLT